MSRPSSFAIIVNTLSFLSLTNLFVVGVELLDEFLKCRCADKTFAMNLLFLYSLFFNPFSVCLLIKGTHSLFQIFFHFLPWDGACRTRFEFTLPTAA